MSFINDLEKRLNNISSNLEASIYPIDISNELGTLSEVWWPNTGFKINSAEILNKKRNSLRWKASVRADVFLENANLILDVKLFNGKLIFDIFLTDFESIDLHHISKELSQGFFAGPLIIFEKLKIEGIKWLTENDYKTSLTLELSSEINLDFGPINIAVNPENISIQFEENQMLGLISFDATIGDLTVPMNCELNNELDFEADLSQLDITSILGAFGINLPPVSDVISLLKFGAGHLNIKYNQPEQGISYSSSIDKLGSVNFVIFKNNESWELVIGITVRDSFKFSHLSELLKPLDILNENIQFNTPGIYYSSVSINEYLWNQNGIRSKVNLQEGFFLNAELELDNYGLELIKNVIGLSSLPILSPIGVDFSTFKLVAQSNSILPLVPNVLTLKDFFIQIAPQPYSITAAGTADLKIFNSKLPELILGMAIKNDGSSFIFTTNEPWEQPLGLPLTIVDTVFHIKTPDNTFSLLGAILIGDVKMRVAGQFLGQVPTMIVGEMQGEFSLGKLLYGLIGISFIPDALDLRLKDFSLRVVASPLGVTIGNSFFPAGLSLKGIISFLGLSLKAELVVDPNSGVIASGYLSKPIVLDPILKITGTNGASTPYVSLDTTKDPLLDLSAEISILGIKESVIAKVGSDKASFQLSQSIGPVSTSLLCGLGEGHFMANGDIETMIRGSVGPIRPMPKGPSLGSFKIDTGFSGDLFIEVNEEGAFEIEILGVCTILNMEINLPRISIKSKLQSLEELPKIIFELISDKALDLLEDIFSTAEEWLKNIAEGLINILENEIGQTLYEHFHKTTDQIAKLVDSTLKLNPKGMLNVLNGAGAAAEDAAKLLIELGNPTNLVKDALKIVFPGSHVDETFGISIAEKGHADIGGEPHVNIAAKLHGDIGGSLHQDRAQRYHTDVDGGFLGHADKTWFGSHTDIGGKAHVNEGAKAHVNEAAKLHTDTPLTPHVDSRNHLDTD